jgi:hypothetical protein
MMKHLLIILLLTMFLFGNISAQRRPQGTVGIIAGQAGSEVIDGIRGETDSKGLYGRRAGQANKIFSIFTSAKELYDGLQALKKGECVPDFNVSAQGMIPSACDSLTEDTRSDSAVGDEEARGGANNCAKCYENAYKKLTDVRRRLGRLKCLGLTMKNFITKANSFGDSVSSIHAVQGLAWQKEKKGISDSYGKFKEAYDSKYKELMETLNQAMIAIDECEAQSGQPDWYQRFGFMYVEFMAEKYKRVE